VVDEIVGQLTETSGEDDRVGEELKRLAARRSTRPMSSSRLVGSRSMASTLS
jgi:hypothetical protein